MSSLLLVLLACGGATPEGTDPVDPDPQGTTPTPGITTPTPQPTEPTPPAQIVAPAEIDEIDISFSGAGASCEAGELSSAAEVIGGADRVWVESYRDQTLVESFELDILSADLEVFQEAAANAQGADCDVDAWVWRAERGTSGACYVTGPEARDLARYLGCLSE